MKRLFAGALGILVLALVLAAGPAFAHTVKYRSTITIQFKLAKLGPPPLPQGQFEGKVRSTKSACERRRKVKLYKQKAGADQLVGSDKTTRQGQWQVELSGFPSGHFYAVATRKVLKHSARHKHICKSAKSEVVSPGPPGSPPGS